MNTFSLGTSLFDKGVSDNVASKIFTAMSIN